jgi:hypothetical protein
MGRKHAPQPLSLADQQSEDSNGSNFNGHVANSAVPPAALSSSPSPDSAASAGPASSIQQHTLNGAVAPAGETSRSAASIPTSSQSPRSPSSPFSRFNPSKKAQASQAQTTQQSPSEVPPSKPRSQKTDRTVASPYTERYGQDVYHSMHQEIAHSAHSQRKFSSASQPNISLASSAPTPREGAGNPQVVAPQLPPREEEREKEKHSRSGSRFFNFSKPPRSAHHLHHGNHSSEAMSREE